MQFLDRRDAGRRLAADLIPFADERPVIVALPRGGVPVGVEVARALGAPLDILVVPADCWSRTPVPSSATAPTPSSGLPGAPTTQATFEATLAQESEELRRRVERYRDGRPPISVSGRTVIVVDDGLATGLTDLAAVRALRKRGARRIVVGVPVGASQSVDMLAEEADKVVCVTVPQRLFGVGIWYRDFTPVSDEEVLALLAEAAGDATTPAAPTPTPTPASSPTPPTPVTADTSSEELSFDLGGVRLAGTLTMPASPSGLVLFAHGSGSSRLSPRNRAVAKALSDAGLATLLFDLLDEQEAQRRELVFDIPLLAGRLEVVTRWALSQSRLQSLPIGYFGASTGAAAALRAAAEVGGAVVAVVSRGGRPDLAGDRLASVVSPTLLIVGGRDPEVLELNRHAAALLRCPHDLVVVDGAGHLFEGPGALERVAELATEWFQRYLISKPDEALSGVG